jgi:DNA mismatch endonuclease, patch repair protein
LPYEKCRIHILHSMNSLKKNKIKVPNFTKQAGFVTTPKLSRVMSKIRSKDTLAEIKLRKAIWTRGFRYKLHYKMTIGKPDLIFISQKVAVFVDGDFWHGYKWKKRKPKLKSNRNYWIPKIERNMQRDKEINRRLRKEGWVIIRFWEHEIKNDTLSCVEILTKILSRANSK